MAHHSNTHFILEQLVQGREDMSEQSQDREPSFLEFKTLESNPRTPSTRKVTKRFPAYLLAATALVAGGLSFAAQATSTPATTSTVQSTPVAPVATQAVTQASSITKSINQTSTPTLSSGAKPQIAGATGGDDGSAGNND